LALALGVTPEFFSGDPIQPVTEFRCHFRGSRSATVKERKRVLARGTAIKRVVDHIREMVNFPVEKLTPLHAIWEKNRDPEALAEAARDIWNLGYGPVTNCVALVESLGVIPLEVPGHTQRLDAFSTWVDELPMMFLSTDKGSSSRRRFDVAHELGHLLMHWNCEPGTREAEEEADAFASAFLLPRKPFVAECPRSIDWMRLRDLKRRWGVSLAAIVRRARDLGILTEATYRRAFTYLNQMGWRTSEPDEPAMEHPALLARALGLLNEAGIGLQQIAKTLSFSEGLIDRLLGTRHGEQFSLGFR
jgi:Zn-dependent peptidase ImmA (M78 family)